MDSIEIRQCGALWYAWGQIDSGLHPHLNLDHGFQFQRWQEGKARDFYEGRRGSIPSLLNDWQAFVEFTKRRPVDLVKKAKVPA